MWGRKQSSEFWRALQKESNIECPRSSLGYEEGTGPSCCVRDNGTRVNVIVPKHWGTSTRLHDCLLVRVNSGCRLLTCRRTLFWFNGLSHAVVHTDLCQIQVHFMWCLTRITGVLSISLHQACGITVVVVVVVFNFVFVSSLFLTAWRTSRTFFRSPGLRSARIREFWSGVSRNWEENTSAAQWVEILPRSIPSLTFLLYQDVMITQSLLNSLRRQSSS